MKKIILSISIVLILPLALLAQKENTKEIETEISEVTVYIEGARITREKSLSVDKGKTTLTFTGLSPYIDAKSLQVNVSGKLTVLSVRHQHNFLNEKKKSDELEVLATRKDSIETAMGDAKTRLSILSEELVFLNSNRSIGGANTGIDIEKLERATDFYASRISGIKTEESKKNKQIRELSKDLVKVNNQMKALNEKTDLPSGEVLVEVSADAKVNARFTVSYLVNNAGWYPSYDIRVQTVSDPMNITYKANVHQNTNVDWSDVNLKFSSGNPSTSGVAPKLKTYYVGYGTKPPVYQKDRPEVSVTYGGKINQVFGTVYDSETNETLPFANVMVKNTTIGTVTDVDGRYSLTLPPNAEVLVFSFIGYETMERSIDNNTISVAMNPSQTQLSAVTISAYEEPLLAKFKETVDIDKGYELERSEVAKVPGRSSGGLYENKRQNIPVDVAQVEYQTNFEFEIKTPYTIPANGKSLSIEVKDYVIEPNYHYYSIPKIEKEAYLTAYIKNWEQYNFMEGEANVFFEDTYVGKTLIDTRYLSDSLEISLGKDKNVMVGRDIQKEFVSKQFFRNRKEEARAWLITVRNNKKQEINITVLDQVPISNSSDVAVDLDELSGGVVDKITGEVKWDLTIKPQEQASRLLKYKVKYPDYWSTVVE